MDDVEDIPAPHESMTDALVAAGFVIGRIIGHMIHSQAVTGRTDPPLEDALYEVIHGTIAPMVEHREFELGVAAQVLHDALTLVMAEVCLLPIDDSQPARRGRRRRR